MTEPCETASAAVAELAPELADLHGLPEPEAVRRLKAEVILLRDRVETAERRLARTDEALAAERRRSAALRESIEGIEAACERARREALIAGAV